MVIDLVDWHPGSNNTIIVPRHKYSQFKTVLAGMPEAQTQGFFARVAEKRQTKRTRTTSHRVSKGETLTGIARQYGVTVASIRKANNITGSNIRIGQKLTIKGATKSRAAASSKRTTKTTTYTVKSGDSVYAIARRYGTSVDQIRRDNGIKGNNIKIGQKLKVRGTTSVASSKSSTRTRTHTVKSGDTLYGIARKYGVTVGAIEEANGLTSTNLRLGQKLKIPAKG